VRVKAIAVGFYPDTLRQPGEVFEVPEGLTGSWYVPVPKDEPVVEKPKVESRQKGPRSLSELAKQSAPKGDDLI
jgi:hypothetical protein